VNLKAQHRTMAPATGSHSVPQPDLRPAALPEAQAVGEAALGGALQACSLCF